MTGLREYVTDDLINRLEMALLIANGAESSMAVVSVKSVEMILELLKKVRQEVTQEHE